MYSAITKSKIAKEGKKKKQRAHLPESPNPTHHVAPTPSDPNAADSCPTHTFVQQILRTEHALGLASYEECRSYSVIILV